MIKDIKGLDNSGSVYIVTCSILSVLLFGGYIFIYQYAPFSDPFNNAALNFITALSSLFVALFASAIYLHYHPEDRPRGVWRNLMIGSWLWFAAELLWAVLDYIYGEVATPGIPDALWVGGFVFFTVAFYWQYFLVAPSQQKRIRIFALAAWAVSLLVPLAGFFSSQTFTFADYINYFYPIADFSVGIAGLWLIFIFRGGALVRPWVGLVVFGISDLFYAWAEQTGVYAWSSENSNLLTLAIDSSYLAAYLILGLGFVGHWILINYGLRRNQK